MQLTKKSSYGLIAAAELASNYDSGPLSATAIANKYSLPLSFMEKILHQLSAADLISATQGRAGGYSLSVDARSISVRQVVEALEEPLDLVGCISGQPDCKRIDVCPTKAAWQQIDRRFKEMLESLTLDTLITE